MPSFGQWFKPFSKKKGHGGNKYHDYHSYDNLRHSNYPTTPPNMMGGGHQHQFNNGNANGNVQAPPHSFPHRQHQLYPQQLIMQSPAPPQFTQQQQPPPPPPQQQQQQQQQPPQPQQQQQQQQPQQQQHQFQPQVITNTHNTANLATNGTTNHHHCQCYQCNSVVQQPQMQIQTNNNHHLQSPQPQQQVSQHQQSPPTQMIGHQAQMQPVLNNHVPIISTPQQQQQQQQQLPLQLQPTQTPQMQQQPQMHQQCQHIHQPTTPQQPAYQCQNNGTYGGYVNQSFTNAQPQIAQSTPQTIPQCTCQHCPHQHQHQHQPQPQHQPQQLISSPQQQQQFMQQHIEHIQTSGTCQHQVAANTMIHTGGTNLNGVNQPIQNHAHNHLIQQHSMNQSCMSHTPQQLAAPIMTSTTPLQQSNMFNTMNTQQQQFQYHTIQPHQYQQHKQQMQHQHLQQQQQQHQMQQHHRVQSLHQQQTQAIQQYAHQPLLAAQQLSAQSQTHLNYQDHSQPQIVAQQASEPRQQDELKSHDTSRYANIKTLMEDNHHTHKTDYSQSSKYQEHVYCNQKPELPPYEPPPDYETFIEHRRMYALEMNGQHLTHHSESLVLQKAKDSSYENLTRFSPYSNLGFGRQEPSFTS